jgi:hypothetical protein
MLKFTSVILALASVGLAQQVVSLDTVFVIYDVYSIHHYSNGASVEVSAGVSYFKATFKDHPTHKSSAGATTCVSGSVCTKQNDCMYTHYMESRPRD